MPSATFVATLSPPYRRSYKRMTRAREHAQLLRAWRNQRGLSRVEAVDEINKFPGVSVSYSHLNKLENGSRPLERANLELREAIRATYGIPREEWESATGLHVPVTAAPPERSSSSQYAAVALTRRVEVYPAGTGPAWDLEDALDPPLHLPADLYPEKQLVGLKAMGNSMAPYLPAGAIAVIVHDDGMVAPGDYCGVRMSDDGVVVKRFVRELEDGALLLESLNPDPGEERLFTAPLGSRVIGKVVRRIFED